MNRVEEFLQILLAASEARKESALQVLRGQAVAVEPGSRPVTFEPLLSRSQVARQLGVTCQTLRRWRVPATSVLGRNRYRLSDIEAYLSSPEFKRRQAALRAERKPSGAQGRPTSQTTQRTKKGN